MSACGHDVCLFESCCLIDQAMVEELCAVAEPFEERATAELLATQMGIPRYWRAVAAFSYGTRKEREQALMVILMALDNVAAKAKR